MSYEVGFARTDITAYEPGMIMLGWAAAHNRVKGVATRLHARACVVRDPKTHRSVVYACADLCFITLAVRQGVLAKLAAEYPERGFGEHNVMLTATHTHSGPSGYSHYIFYNASNFGFSRVVYESIVGGFVRAIVEADDRRTRARLRAGTVTVPLSEPVAFNRSLEAYNANDDVRPVGRPELATDRTTTTLVAEDERGRALGLVTWFAVHPTSVHAENTLLHGDNKGLAASMFEEHAGRHPERHAPDFVAIFAQTALGDVSPNFRWHPERRRMIGIVDDDYAAAEANARIQLTYARAAMDRADVDIEGALEGRTEFRDFADAPVLPRFARGRKHRRTRHACFGIGMARGTDEGPGPFHKLTWLHSALHRAKRVRSPDDNQVPLVELGLGCRGSFLGVFSTNTGFELGRFDAGIDYLRATYEAGTMGTRPWTPHILPIQVIRIGSLAIGGVPAEPTTVAGRRLTAVLEERLSGLSHVLVNGCANAYTSYVTTFEEYALQRYEGASTHFGPHTLGAHLTAFDELTSESMSIAHDAPVRGPAPPTFTIDEMEAERRSGQHVRHKRRMLNDLMGAG
jgi:neutral ceramidase